ncbi:MAG TPA: CHASE2 domain-containing protein, partial [Allosphingosinicella sp.]
MLIRVADLFARRAGIVILALALIAGFSATMVGWAVPIDNGLEQVRHSLFRKTASGETVVVAIDSRSLSRLRGWPFPRSVHGQLVDRLRESGASTIVFDVVFPDPAADPAQDRAFAAAISRAGGRVVLPGLLENTDQEFGSRVEALPAPALRAVASVGSIWIRLDDVDGVARRLPYSVAIEGAQRPSLAAFLAGRPSTSRESFPLDWSIDPASFPTVSYSDVLEGRFPRNFFAGKNVLIGATSTTLGDRFFVPSHNRIPGLYIQAVGAETLRRQTPRPIGEWPALALVLGFIACAAFAGRPA